MYQFAGLKFGRPIRFKAAIYFIVFLVIEAIIYFTPGLTHLINWIPFGVLIMIPFGLAWLLSDVGTEDRSPIKFFGSFIKYNIKRIKGNTYYRDRKIPVFQTYSFGNYLTFSTNNESKKQSAEVTNRVKEKTKVDNTISIPSDTKEATLDSDVVANTSNNDDQLLQLLFSDNQQSDDKDIFDNVEKTNNEDEELRKLLFSNEEQYEQPSNMNEVSMKVQDMPSLINHKEDKKPKTNSRVERLEEKRAKELRAKELKQSKKTNKNKSKLPLLIASLIGVLILSFVIVNFVDLSNLGQNEFVDTSHYEQEENGDELVFNHDMSEDEEENLKNGLRSSSLQEYEEAVKYFDNVNFDSLNQEDKEVVLLSYLFTDQAEKAMDLEPDFAEVIASYYVAQDDIQMLRYLADRSDVFRFEIAVDEEDYESIIKYKDSIEMNEERELQILYAYAALGEKEEAVQFAEETENEKLIALAKEIKEEKDAK